MRRDSSGVSIVESSEAAWSAETAWRIASEPALSIGDTDGPWEQQFAYVRDATVVEDLVVVTEGSAGEVRYYDLEGRHLATIGRHGEGPGEFSATASMKLCWRSDGSLAVTDDSRSRVHIASSDRRFVATESLPLMNGRPPWPHDCLSDGTWLAQGTTHQTQDGEVTWSALSIHVVDASGRVTEEVVRLNRGGTWWHPELEDQVALPFSARDHVLASGSELVVLRASEGQVEWLTREGRLQRIGRRVGLARTRTANVVDDQAFYDRGLRLPELVPLYQNAHVDPEGNVWAHRYRIPEETSLQHDVFDSTGVWLGTVEIPPEVTVYEIGSDYLVGTSQDSLDVRRVQVYRIVKQNQDG